MVSFDELMNKTTEEVARHMGEGPDRPQGHVYMRANAVLRYREFQAVDKAAQQAQRYARYTFWVAVCTAVTAVGTLLVALFTGLMGS